MKIVIYSGRNMLGTAETGEGDELIYVGPKEWAVRELVEWYANSTGLRGVPLLVYVVLRVHGMGAWADEVTDEEAFQRSLAALEASEKNGKSFDPGAGEAGRDGTEKEGEEKVKPT